MMNKYLNPDEPGHDKLDGRYRIKRPQVKNQRCPRDGHYCEQPNCENCMFEVVGENE